ncbi:fibronectin type III domain-containing protein [Dactylosporangium sp. NPDC000521]|uniref:fibronectin type III domain-containing protein n=1 Tax=Dactylosporangium sp. NPDC000521 TaxID=3363975 RepID=UPI0036835D5C
MRRLLHAALAALLALGVGLVVPGSPAQAALNCDVPKPPPRCNPTEPVDPEGVLTSATRVPGGVAVVGWATDPGGYLVRVSVMIDNIIVGTLDAARSGSFSGTVPAWAGANVCALAVTTSPAGGSTHLGCVSLAVALNPVGGLDSFERSGTDLVLKGWAIDGDTTGAVDLHLYHDGAFAGTARADGPLASPPVGYPNYGTAHGYTVRTPERPGDGAHTICLYAINVGAGSMNTLLGCRQYTVKHDPFGALDGVTRTGDKLRVWGWSVDPDEPRTPTDVHFYDSGVFVGSVTANGNRTDLPGEYGPAHGYDLTLPVRMTAGDHSVCAYAINRSYGSNNTQLGCRTYNVPAPVVAPTILPFQEWDLTSKLVDLEWTDNSTSETGHRIERSVAGGPWQEIWRDDRNVRRTYADNAVTPNTRYCYRVIAFNDISEAAAEVCATTKFPALPRPTGVTMAGRTDNSITFRWTDNADGEDHYLVGWGRSTDSGATSTATVPARPGTGGEMTYTITGLPALTGYRFYVLPVKAGYDNGDTVSGTGGTSGPPVVDTFTSSTGSVEACAPRSVTLKWQTSGASRVVVSRGGTVLYDQTRDLFQWSDEVGGGTHDGNVTYTLTAYGPDGRTTTKTVTVARTTSLPLYKSIEFKNTNRTNKMYVWYYDRDGWPLEQVAELNPGETYKLTLQHCVARRIRVIEGYTGRVAWETSPMIILGYNEGHESTEEVR